MFDKIKQEDFGIFNLMAYFLCFKKKQAYMKYNENVEKIGVITLKIGEKSTIKPPT